MNDKLKEIESRVTYEVEVGSPFKYSVKVQLDDYVWMQAEIKRLKEAYEQAKSEAFQAQRELWRTY